MKLYLLLILVFSSFSWSQTESVKHPRVLELEELFRDEASRYFERRFPNEAFFVRVDVTPLRRDSINNGSKGESLPYFDYESEEGIDEWDDVKTPLAFLRSRVSKVAIELSVPEKFSDERVASLRDELSIYLRLLPYRDDVKVERKIKDKSSFDVPAYAFVVIIGILMATLVGAFIIRSGLKKSGLSGTAQTSPSVPAAQAPQVSSPQVTKHSDKKSSSTAVSGDVTFHDPIKLLDVVHLKIEQIEKSETFPTLNDLMTLSELATRSSGKLSSLLAEFPQEWRKAIFPLGKGQEWLEAFCQNERIDFESLNILDKISRERSFSKKDRLWEDLIIQVWRGSDRLVPFFKKIPVDHAFLILESIPKTVSLSIAKKAFPGAWGRLLEKQGTEIALTPSILKDYIEQSRGFEPILEWSMLESYRKDREILDYLDRVTIDDEKDVYDTIAEDSFIIKVRPPFFQVFELEEEEWILFVRKFPLEQWALSVVNSSRHFIKKIMDALDEKQKLVFSQHLRRFDSNLDLREQTRVRREIASTYSVQKTIATVAPATPELKGESDAQSA
jgi:hypothetical protein